MVVPDLTVWDQKIALDWTSFRTFQHINLQCYTICRGRMLGVDARIYYETSSVTHSLHASVPDSSALHGRVGCDYSVFERFTFV